MMPYGIIPQLSPKISPKILHNMGSTNCFDEKNIKTNCLRDLGHNSGKKGLVNVINILKLQQSTHGDIF